MYWQRGFAIQVNRQFDHANANGAVTVKVDFVHADGPKQDVSAVCDRGCCNYCLENLPADVDLTKENCLNNATEEMRPWYATCDQWTSKD